MSLRTAALGTVQPRVREDSLVILARLIVDGEAHRLARINELAHLIAGGANTAEAEQALHELGAVLAAMRAYRDRLQAAHERDRPHEASVS